MQRNVECYSFAPIDGGQERRCGELVYYSKTVPCVELEISAGPSLPSAQPQYERLLQGGWSLHEERGRAVVLCPADAYPRHCLALARLCAQGAKEASVVR